MGKDSPSVTAPEMHSYKTFAVVVLSTLFLHGCANERDQYNQAYLPTQQKLQSLCHSGKLENIEQAESIARAQDKSIQWQDLGFVAEAFESAGDHARAGKLYREAVEARQEFDCQIYTKKQLGKFYCKRKRFEDAEVQFKQCVALCERQEGVAIFDEPKTRFWNMIFRARTPSERERAQSYHAAAMSDLADCYAQWGKPKLAH